MKNTQELRFTTVSLDRVRRDPGDGLERGGIRLYRIIVLRRSK